MPKATPAPRPRRERRLPEEDMEQSALYGIPEKKTKIIKFELDHKQTHILIESDNSTCLKDVLGIVAQTSRSEEVQQIVDSEEN